MDMINRNTILKQFDIKALTPMQEELLSKHATHKNIMLLSPTGSGKTLAYLIASFEKIKQTLEKQPQVIVIAPTRELVLQIAQVAKSCATQCGVVALYGGRKVSIEVDMLAAKPEIIVATPGRLCDHLSRENFSVDQVHHIVIDEYDKCVEMGFTDELVEIFSFLQNIETRIITSATSSAEIPKFISFRDGLTIDYTSDSAPLSEGNIETKVVIVKENHLQSLYELLTTLKSAPTLVFCNFRESCERVYDFLRDKGIVCDFYHGAQEQYIRERALLKLRMGAIDILIATDIAARGLDIDMLTYVIHYEQPQSIESFTHRSGRTGRMDSSGENYILTKNFDMLPDYVAKFANEVQIKPQRIIFSRPKFSMLYIGAGRKQKISKGDIVGFLMVKCKLNASEIGIIQIWDNESYVAVSSKMIDATVAHARGQKIKKSKPVFRYIR